MKFDEQIARIASKSEMHGRIDDMPDDAHAVLLVWYADGTKAWAQMGMDVLGQVTHLISGFLHDIFAGRWNHGGGE